jgi:hypothetical protein
VTGQVNIEVIHGGIEASPHESNLNPGGFFLRELPAPSIAA